MRYSGREIANYNSSSASLFLWDMKSKLIFGLTLQLHFLSVPSIYSSMNYLQLPELACFSLASRPFRTLFSLLISSFCNSCPTTINLAYVDLSPKFHLHFTSSGKSAQAIPSELSKSTLPATLAFITQYWNYTWSYVSLSLDYELPGDRTVDCSPLSKCLINIFD